MNVNIEINLLKDRIAILEKQFEAMKDALDSLAVPAKRTVAKAEDKKAN